jgi:hypothetical protein
MPECLRKFFYSCLDYRPFLSSISKYRVDGKTRYIGDEDETWSEEDMEQMCDHYYAIAPIGTTKANSVFRVYPLSALLSLVRTEMIGKKRRQA